MPLSNSQYDEIMREYNKRQLENRRIQDARRAEIYRKIPRLREIDSSVASVAVQKARLFLNGTGSAMGDLKDSLATLGLEREQLLLTNGYPKDYLNPVYTCPDCKDTGYRNGQKCHC